MKELRRVQHPLVSPHTLGLLAALCLTAGCSDPADSVYKSSASKGVELDSTPEADAQSYALSDTSTIGFIGSKVTGSHEGGFKEFDGTILVVDGKVAAGSSIEITMNSTWSDNERLTGHLKSPDFFDTAKYPTATFTVTNVESSNPGPQVTGNLELHGVTKSISFPATIEVTASQVTVQAEFAINRKDFGINYPGRPDDLIRENVVIKIAASATTSSPPQA